MTLTIPNRIRNGIPVDGNNLQANFDAIEDHANSELINKDGSVVMAAALTLSGDPSSDNHAARKAYVDTAVAGIAPTMRWQRTTDTAIPQGTNYTVVWESEIGSAGWSQSGATLTCGTNGVYLFSLYGNFTNTNASGINMFRANASQFLNQDLILPASQITNSSAAHVSTGGVLYVVSGTQLKMMIAASGGSTTLETANLTITQLATI